MWIYHSLAYAAKSATRFASVHGKNCETSPNSCQTSLSDVALVLQEAAPALIPNETTVSFSMGADAGPVASGGSDVTCLLDACVSSYTGTLWPDDRTIAGTPPTYRPGNGVGETITITVRYPFRSALSFFWPGTTPFTFGTILLSASSTDQVQF
jgi:hypothetical protein